MEPFRYRYLLTNGDDQAQNWRSSILANVASAASSHGSSGTSFRSTGCFPKPDRRDNGLALVLYDGRAARATDHQPTHLRSGRRPASAARGARGISVSGAWEIVAGATGSAQPVPATDRPPVVENGGRRRERPELPNLITAPAAMATGTEIRSQSRAARKIAMRGSVS